MNRAFSGFAVFDLDGTLADSLADISRALGRVLQRNGRKGIPEAETRELIGKGPRTLIERAWKLTGESAGEEEVAILTRQYLEEYRKNPKGGTRSFPGVDDGLRRLVQKGWRLGLCTNKDGRAARALVEELGWGRWIRTVVSGEEGFRKPDPRPLQQAFRQLRAPRGRHLFVGDSEVDLRTARNAGVEGVFLGHGYGEFGKMGMDGMHYFEEAVAMFRWMAGNGGPAGKIRKD
ncbi:HAD family hydrolase [bacterium]|nr:HAD family hydrolase [bacterium]